MEVNFVLSRLPVLPVLPALVLAGFFFASPAPTLAATPITPVSVIALTNADRAAKGLAPLRHDTLLDAAAQKKANDMVRRGYFSHIDPSGQGPWKWFTAVGFYYVRAGENLGANFSDAKSLERAWMNSPTHRANLLSTGYTRMGIGTAKGMYNGKETLFVVQFFAKPATLASR
jgi:uncharacterized protein YkwD